MLTLLCLALAAWPRSTAAVSECMCELILILRLLAY